ncbi:12585_t:CDS:2 [Ambispora gerdemannii]|uniref:12585_t:CDS:1 n=1 Tax=Ambispora gerdemannii TaxID=144530 RepID=A0A9N9EZU3_9GLOM|nr:12585_t:CDS:2 [Ambispora gerdemannii]
MSKQKKSKLIHTENQEKNVPLINTNSFVSVPPEIFIDVCKYLPPIDLLSLAQVCRLFNAYLASDESTSTQLIWRQSRFNFLPCYSVPPPDNFSEREYLRLIVEKGCQRCENRRVNSYWINWSFLARCCCRCFNTNLCLKETLEQDYNIPHKVIEVLPTRSTRDISIYFKPIAKKIYRQYLELSDEKDKLLFLERQRKIRSQLETTQSLRSANEISHKNSMALNALRQREIRREAIKQRVSAMINEQKEDGSLKWNAKSCMAVVEKKT